MSAPSTSKKKDGAKDIATKPNLIVLISGVIIVLIAIALVVYFVFFYKKTEKKEVVPTLRSAAIKNGVLPPPIRSQVVPMSAISEEYDQVGIVSISTH